MANGKNSYEEERKKQLEANKRRLEELGVAKMAQDLKEVTTMKKNPTVKNAPKVRSKKTTAADSASLRRSSRPRSAVVSYADEYAEEDKPKPKKPRSGKSTRVRLPHEKVATEEERADALARAEILKDRLESTSGHPCCVKGMTSSQVYVGCWMNVPTEFSSVHLTKNKETIWLEDEDGKEYKIIWIGQRTGLSGGWKEFAHDHKLDDGDAVVFELLEQTRLKVHIIRPSNSSGEGNVGNVEEESISEEVEESDHDEEEDVEKSDGDVQKSDEEVTEPTSETNRSTSRKVQPGRRSKQIAEPKKPAKVSKKNAQMGADEPKKPIKRRKISR